MLIIVILAVLFVFSIAIYKINDYHWYYEGLSITSMFISVASGVILFMCGSIICLTHLTADAEYAQRQVVYDALVYQVEHDIYDNDNDIGKTELVNEIINWNKWVEKNRVYEESLWLNWFVPDKFSDFNVIDYNKIT